MHIIICCLLYNALGKQHLGQILGRNEERSDLESVIYLLGRQDKYTTVKTARFLSAVADERGEFLRETPVSCQGDSEFAKFVLSF